MKFKTVFIIASLFLFKFNFVVSSTFNELLTLEKNLSQKNPTRIRPVLDQTEKIHVNLSVYILSILEVNHLRQTIEISYAFHLNWRDETLTWNVSDYGGINKFKPPQGFIWIPFFSCLQCLEGNMFEEEDHDLTIHYDGQIAWTPKKTFITSCPLQVRYFPNDNQTCLMHFFPLRYPEQEVELINIYDRAQLEFFNRNGEWELIHTRIDLQKEIYTSKSLLTLSITLQRGQLYFIQNIVIPIVLLSFLNLFTFWLPDDSGEKISFSLTMLLAQTVFLSTTSDSLPRTSNELVLITFYLTCLLIISCIISIASIILLFFHHKRKRREKEKKNSEKTAPISNNTGVVNSILNSNKVCPSECVRKARPCPCCRLTMDMVLFVFIFLVWNIVTLVIAVKIISKDQVYGQIF